MTTEKNERIQQATITAHQIKGPVATLQTILQTLLGGFAGELGDRQRSLLRSADSKCSEVMATISGLLSLADAMVRNVSNAAADLIAVTREACERYRRTATDKQIEFIARLGLEEAWVQAWPAALQEAVVALVDNAIKYTPDGGRVIVRVADAGEGQVVLTVSDSGIGISEGDYARIFQPFFRAANARKLLPSGTGLGLAFAQTVATTARGSIKAGRSELGGAELTVTFPQVQRPSAARQEEKAPHRKPSFRALVIGGVAAGPKIASRIMRLAPDAEVTIIEKGRMLAYSGCGLPYYISGKVRDESQLLTTEEGVVRGPEYFERVKNVRIMHRTEALKIDRQNKRVLVKDLVRGEETWLPYDKLALATGSLPIVLNVPGANLRNIFTLQGLEHAEGIRAVVAHRRAVDVTIVGGGLIGVQMTESLVDAGCRVTLVELQPQVLRGFDWEMAEQVRRYFESKGIRVMVSTGVTAFEGDDRVQRIVTEKGSWSTDMVIMGIGVSPNSKLAADAGLETFLDGGIKVDEHMLTSDPDIYAAGDCVESRDLITGGSCYAPFGGVANRQGRVAADNICGKKTRFPGVLGTAICRAFEMTIARTGLTDSLATESGHNTVTALAAALDRANFMPDAKLIMLKAVADTSTRKLLGLQAIGFGEVAKRVDVAATALTAGLTVDDISNLDLCYAPSYSNAFDNIQTVCNVAKNKLDGHLLGISPIDLYRKMQSSEPPLILDVRIHAEFEERPPIEGCLHVPLPVLKARMDELPRDKEIVIYSLTSMSAYEASIILRGGGFKNAKVLDGGIIMWPYGAVGRTSKTG